MKTNTKTGITLGVLATMTAVGTVYYYMKKNNKSASDMLEQGLAKVEDAADSANKALKDATSYTQKKAKVIYKNAKEGFEEGVEKVEEGFNDVAKEVKKSIEKTI